MHPSLWVLGPHLGFQNVEHFCFLLEKFHTKILKIFCQILFRLASTEFKTGKHCQNPLIRGRNMALIIECAFKTSQNWQVTLCLFWTNLYHVLTKILISAFQNSWVWNWVKKRKKINFSVTSNIFLFDHWALQEESSLFPSCPVIEVS